MSRQEEAQVCLNCKFKTCKGAADCPALKVNTNREFVRISLLRDLLMAGYDPAEICFAVVEGTTLA